MNKLYSLLIILLISFSVFAQEKIITGKVVDSKGNPLPYVSIQLMGTTKGTVTDINGTYKIAAESGVLQFSFIGYVAQEVQITNQTTIDVILLEESKTLEEVVVIAYGKQKKKDLTTSVAVVGEKEIKDRVITSAGQALQGKAAGVQVVQPSGKPGQELAIRIRGLTSIRNSNDPLYVIDGVPTMDVNGISPTDISSISVLKDASGTAIYGARGANGVVLITTKRGSSESPTVNFSSYTGFSTIRQTIEVLSTKQYRILINEIMPGSLDPTRTGYTNWSDKVFGTGKTQSYQFSYSGGTDKSNYYFSTGYLRDEGIVKPAKMERYSVKINYENQIKPWLKVGSNVNVLRIRTKDTPDNASSGRGGVIMSALNTPPFLYVYKDQDKPDFELTKTTQFDSNPFQPSWENPIAYMSGPDQLSEDRRVLGNIFMEINLLKGLTYKVKVGLEENSHSWDYYLDPFRTNYGRQQNGVGQSDKSIYDQYLLDNILEYSNTFGAHNVSGLIGSSIEKEVYKDSYLSGNDFPSDINVRTLNAANTISGSTSVGESALSSFIGRIMYDYSSKYYLTLSIRRDGSSKLNHKWGTMPSFSLGWRISSEEFMKSFTFIDDLKLRGGWGVNGNQSDMANYTMYGLTQYSRRTPTDPLSGPYSYQVSMGNPDLKWETTVQSGIGLDLAMFKSRVTIVADAYLKKTLDVILPVEWPATLNIPELLTNAAEIENRGFELNISSINIDRKFKWSSDFNISINRNEVTYLKYVPVSFYGRVYSNNQDVSILKVGLPLGSLYGYVADGVDPTTGNMKYKDINNNEIAGDPGDRKVIGNPQPKFIIGLTNTLSYGSVSLNIFFQGSYGNDIFNATRVDLEGMFDSKNQSTVVLNRWTTPGQVTDIPRVGNMDNVKNSTRFIEDGSYLRLKSMTLSYKVLDNNPKFKSIKKFSVYVTGNNLLTFTKYSGFDPEVNAFGGSAVEMGIDYGTYPQARSIIAGVNLEF